MLRTLPLPPLASAGGPGAAVCDCRRRGRRGGSECSGWRHGSVQQALQVCRRCHDVPPQMYCRGCCACTAGCLVMPPTPPLIRPPFSLFPPPPLFNQPFSPDELRAVLEAGPLAASSGRLSERIGAAQVQCGGGAALPCPASRDADIACPAPLLAMLPVLPPPCSCMHRLSCAGVCCDSTARRWAAGGSGPAGTIHG